MKPHEPLRLCARCSRLTLSYTDICWHCWSFRHGSQTGADDSVRSRFPAYNEPPSFENIDP